MIAAKFDTETFVFQALSEPTRIRILHLLIQSKSEVCLCDLARVLGEPAYKLSRHVKILREAGLITSLRSGRWVYHRAVQGNPKIRGLYLYISQLPKAAFVSDTSRLRKLLSARNNSRCTGSIRSPS